MTDNSKDPINPVLIVDNDKSFIDRVEKELRQRFITNVKVCTDGSTLIAPEGIDNYAFILLNMSIPGIDGKALASKILDDYPKIPVILISAEESLADAVKFMKQGALYYYLKKNIDHSKLIEQIGYGIRLYESIKPIITQSKKMRSVFRDIARVAQNNIAVLVRGETGVGKELVAEAIHLMSGRKGKFVRMNIASFDDALFADTLFGHVKSAFDGAKDDRIGLIEKAHGGTIFMDQIGDLKSDSQVRLLRLLQYGTYYKLGSDKEIQTDTKVIAATNRNIEGDIREGKSREDFFQQLKGFTISIPPLRERKEDIPLLVKFFIMEALKKNELKQPESVDAEFINILSKRDFKGNIRELKDLIQNLVAEFSGCGTLIPEMLEGLNENSQMTSTPQFVAEPTSMDNRIPATNIPTFIEVEASYYWELLIRSGNDQTKASKWADLERRTFNNRLQSIKDKLKEKGKDFDDIPPLTELVKRFPSGNA